jgi:HD-like signal output (HDOD) protein
MSPGGREKLIGRLEAGYALPALSIVAMRLVELASDDACSASDLAGLIERDPALATRLIRLANSAFFKTGQPATSLKQAIMRIGFHQLRIMALSLSLRETFPMGRIGAFDYEEFWRASLYRALIAKSLASRLKTCNPEEAFVAGLTLEVGFLILFDLFIRERGSEIGGELDRLDELLPWERGEYGIDHREVGEIVLRFWKFPETVTECQACHGRAAFPPRQAPSLATICDLARELSGALLQPSQDFTVLFEYGRETFGLDHNSINEIVLDAFQQVMEIAESLKIAVNRDTDLLELMEKANRALSRISERIARYQDRAEGDAPPSFETLAAKAGGHAPIAYTLEAVAHEIRNPLVAVAGFAKKLATSLDPSSKGGRYARIILDEARRLEVALNEMSG